MGRASCPSCWIPVFRDGRVYVWHQISLVIIVGFPDVLFGLNGIFKAPEIDDIVVVVGSLEIILDLSLQCCQIVRWGFVDNNPSSFPNTLFDTSH